MSITINTANGTFIVPSEKYDLLINWLTNNAINVSPSQQLREIQQPFDGTQRSVLLNEAH